VPTGIPNFSQRTNDEVARLLVSRTMERVIQRRGNRRATPERMLAELVEELRPIYERKRQ
jgi:hypothetical protein